MHYSPNPQINQVVLELLAIGVSPVPVAPKQNSRKDWCHRVSTNKDDIKFCPLDKHLNPIPRFTGKNPSYLSLSGQAFILEHGQYKNKLPTEEELKKWFCNPNTGIGAMCGMGGVTWIDFDSKTFDSQDECNQAVSEFLTKNNLTNNWIEQTGSGGWRIPVVTEEKPSFTNFALESGGKHRGEALGYGRFTVLAPSIHPNGKSYSRVSHGGIAKATSLEVIGIFPAKEEVKQSERKQRREQAQISGYSLSKDFDDTLDVRNFAKYFDGYHERGNGWGYAQCPHHANATSLTSFRVNLTSGAFKAWCGCDTADVWRSGLDLAKSRGFIAPDKPKAKTVAKDEETRRKQDYEAKRRKRAKFNLTREAQITVNSGYLPSIDLKDIEPGIIGLSADWGSGKSFLISRWSRQWEHKIIQVAHLNALLSNTAPKFDCFHHHELKDMQLGVTSASRLSITDVSLGAMFEPEKWAKGEPFILVIDEVEQVFKSCQTNGNLKGIIRLKARLKLEQLIRSATYIIVSDRDLSDETLDYIEQVKGDNKKAFIIQHTGKKGKQRKPIIFNCNKKKDEVLSRLISDAKAGKKIIIPCENKTDLLAIELLLLDAKIADKSMFFAHGDNSNEPGIKELIQEADRIYTNYQILGYTMTMGTALSFEIEHFEKCYAFFSGDVLSAGEQAQMLFRYRLDCDTTIWASPKQRTLEIEPDKLLSNLKINTNETDQIVASIDQIGELVEQGFLPTAKGEIAQNDIPWLQYKLNIIARTNASKANNYQTLHDLLIDAGFTLKIESSDQPITTEEGEELTERKKEIKEAKDKAIANADLMTEPEFQSAMINAGNLKKSERDRLEKTRLHRDTGLEIDQHIVELQRTKKLTWGAKLLKVILGDESTAVAYDLSDRERNPDVGDQSFYAAKRRLLCKLGIPTIIEKLQQGWEYRNDSPEVVELGDKARFLRTDVKRLLGFTVSLEKNKKGSFKVSNSAILGSILNILCVERKSEKNKKGRTYKLDVKHWEMLEKIMSHMDKQNHTPTLQKIIDKANESMTTVTNDEQNITTEQLENDWLNPESLEVLRSYLEACETPEMLTDIRNTAPASALKLAARQLPEDKKQIIKQWVMAA